MSEDAGVEMNGDRALTTLQCLDLLERIAPMHLEKLSVPELSALVSLLTTAMGPAAHEEAEQEAMRHSVERKICQPLGGNIWAPPSASSHLSPANPDWTATTRPDPISIPLQVANIGGGVGNDLKDRLLWMEQITQVCHSQLGCTDNTCRRIHCRYNPDQEAEYKRRLQTSTRDYHHGHALCRVFHLKKKCFNENKCNYRHYTEILPLTVEQTNAITFLDERSRTRRIRTRHKPTLRHMSPPQSSVQTPTNGQHR